MALPKPLLLALLTTALLAGCTETATAPEEGQAVAEEASPAGPADSEGSVEAVEDGPVSLRSAVCSGEVQAGAGVQGNLQMGVYCPFSDAARGDLSAYQAAIVEVRWPDAGPTQTSFNLFLLSEGCNFTSEAGSCNLDFQGNPGPVFRYEVPKDLLRSEGDDGLRVYASFDGPAVQQTVDIAVTLVPPGGVLPEGHSALPA